MTIKKIFSKKLVQCEAFTTKSLYNAMFDIDFINSENLVDETQFTVNGNRSANEISNTLTELFFSFCIENGL